MKKQTVSENQTLRIHMFGEFSITNQNHSLTLAKKSGLTGFLLIAYLLSNKTSDITSDTLIELLWPDSEISNPGGALRTLCYRTRKQLEPFFPNENTEIILHTNNIYSWNPSISCEIDVYEFEEYCHRAFRESDPALQFEYLEAAFALYKGEFLPTFSMQSWVLFRSNYYGNLYIKCVNYMCQYLISQQRFEELLALCDKALGIAPPTDETLHKQKMNALLLLQQTQSALDYYYYVLSMFSQKYGLDITESMKDIYQHILNSMPNQFQTMSSLEKNLRQKDLGEGSFYCNFDIFQNIYQINLRSVRRSRSRHFLILLTLTDETGSSLITAELKEEMDILHDVMAQRLRSNDVYTKSSICQFSLIIAAQNEGGCQVVTRRLAENYTKKNQHPNITLAVKSKEIL